MNFQEFEDWFERPIEILIAYKHAGFPVLMTALPLAERYFRQKSRNGSKKTLVPKFYEEFRSVYDTLNNNQLAEKFWECYRHGLMHQAAFLQHGNSAQPGVIPSAFITPTTLPNVPIIHFDSDRNHFLVKPHDFARKIIEVIKQDWSTFEAPDFVSYPLADTGPYSVKISGDGDSIETGATGCPAPLRNTEIS